MRCWNATVRAGARTSAVLALLLAVFGATGRAAVAAAPMRFERLGLDDGLSQQAVMAIAQDPTGFMWFGTEDGLDRFDGYTFQHLRHSAVRSSLPDEFITDVRFGPSGRLWVATDGGAVVWRDSPGQEFHSVLAGMPQAATRGIEHARVICFDQAGRLWIGTREGGLARFDPNSGQLLRLRHAAADPASLSDDSIFALLADTAGGIWVGTQAGLDRLDPVSGRFQHVALDHGRLAPPRVLALARDGDDTLWIGTDSGLLQLSRTTGRQRLFRHDAADPRSLPSAQVNTLHVDTAGRLWVGTPDGLALFDRDAGSFDSYRNDPADASTLPDNHILTLRADRSGLLWIGTKFGGVARWNPRTWSFGQHTAGAEEGLPSRNVMAFTEDSRGRLWIATFGGGISIVDPKADPRAARHITLHHGPQELSDDRVMALLTDRDGIIWAGTMGGGLDRIEPHTLRVTSFNYHPNDTGSLGARGVMSLLQDSAGRLWVGTFGGGLSRLERGSGRFQRYLPDPRNAPSSLSASRVTALAEDRTGRIWVGTDGGGLNVLDPTTGRFFHLQHEASDPHSLSGVTVYSIYVDSKGTVWVGTRSGLDRVVGSALTPAGIHFDNFNERDGFPNDTVYGIHADQSGKLWLSTNYGLVRFDPSSREVRIFHRGHGLQEEEFNFGAHYASRTGMLYFGGAKGYNAFDPAAVEFNTVAPPVALTAVSELGKVLPLTAGFVMPRLHYRDVVSFEFAALDFAAPRANAFVYELEGFDGSWQRAGTRHTVTYTNLPAGHYVLRVSAANPDRVWSPQGLALPFDVDPPFWLSHWAYLGYALLLLAMLAAAWTGHRRSLIREARYSERLKDEVRARTRELAERNCELEQVNIRLEQASLTDPLTGLGNRRSLMKEMPDLLAQMESSQFTDKPQRLSLMLVDLDRLKPINDQHGHEAGDVALEGVAGMLRACLRGSDRAVRWGGDEFVIVRVHSDIDDAAKLAEEIRAKTAELRFPVSESSYACTTCSIGFACYPFVAEAPLWATWEDVLNLADLALYRAKVRRDAWLGWCGLPRAARQTELFRLMSTDPHTAYRSGYIDVRVSRRGNESNAGVEIPTRRVHTV